MNRLLDSAKLLSKARQPRLSASLLRAVAEEIRGNARMSAETWDALQLRTQEEGFGLFDNIDRLQIYRPYLEQCVAYEPSKQDIGELLPILSREENVDGLFYLGTTYLDLYSDSVKAIECFDEALRFRSDSFRAHLGRGAALGALRRPHEELEAYDRALNSVPDDVAALTEILVNKSAALVELRRNQEAMALIDQALSHKPDNSAAWYNKGLILQIHGYQRDALVAYERALGIRANYPEAWTNRGAALSTLGLYHEAVEAYDAALRLEPDLAEAVQGRDTVMNKFLHHQEAFEARAAELERSRDHQGLLHLGITFGLDLQDNENALSCFERLTRLKPDLPEAWDFKGVALENLDRFEEALEAHDEALRLRPDYPKAWNGRGLALTNLNRLEEGLESFEEALRLKPDYPDAQYNKGLALLHLGADASGEDRLWQEEGHLDRERALPYFEQALVCFDRAIHLKPAFPEAWDNKGLALRYLDRFEEALEAHDEALRLRPDYPDAQYNKGLTLIMLERYSEAIEWLCRAWHSRDRFPDRGHSVAWALRELGYHPEDCE